MERPARTRRCRCCAGSEPCLGAFRQGLRESGFVEGRNLAVEARYADDRYERLPALAADLIGRRVAVIGAATVVGHFEIWLS
jgi:hypothetical protein